MHWLMSVHDIGLPHSEIIGSQAPCRLPDAYRRLVRPSSAVCAKASSIRSIHFFV